MLQRKRKTSDSGLHDRGNSLREKIAYKSSVDILSSYSYEVMISPLTLLQPHIRGVEQIADALLVLAE
jgi:hypothetical protein